MSLPIAGVLFQRRQNARQAEARATSEALFRQYGRDVYAQALRMLGQPSDAEDATQQVFLSAHEHLATFRGEASERTWLYRMTFNHCLNMLRRRRVQRDKLVELAAMLGRAEEGQLELRVAVRELARAVPDLRFAQAAYLVDVEGLTQAQAAEALDVSARTVRTWRSRFRRWAREVWMQSP